LDLSSSIVTFGNYGPELVCELLPTVVGIPQLVAFLDRLVALLF